MGQLLFVHRTACYCDHGLNGVEMRKLQTHTVIGKKYPGYHPSRSFVAIAKAVISGERPSVGCGQIGCIGRGLAEGVQLFGP